jgi:hypothetical protein
LFGVKVGILDLLRSIDVMGQIAAFTKEEWLRGGTACQRGANNLHSNKPSN